MYIINKTVSAAIITLIIFIAVICDVIADIEVKSVLNSNPASRQYKIPVSGKLNRVVKNDSPLIKVPSDIFAHRYVAIADNAKVIILLINEPVFIYFPF